MLICYSSFGDKSDKSYRYQIELSTFRTPTEAVMQVPREAIGVQVPRETIGDSIIVIMDENQFKIETIKVNMDTMKERMERIENRM